MGQAPSGDTYNTDGKGLPLVAGAGDFGPLRPDVTKFTTSPTKVSRPGEIILCIRATIGDRNWSDSEYCLGRGVAGLLGRTKKLDQRYLWHWLGYATPELKSKGRGATFLQVSKADIGSLEIPLPSLAEQRRIAAILDKADALRAKRREAIAKLDQLLQSVFLEMFGDSSDAKGWPVQRIDEVSECLDRLRKPVTAKDRTLGRVPYYGANGQQGWIDRALFNEPLVLVAEDGGHFDHPERGVAYHIDGPAWVNNHAHILRAKPGVIETEYLHRALRHFDFIPYVSGSTRAKLTQGQLNSVPIVVPPIELQRKFGRIVETIMRQIGTVSRHASHLDTLFATLQHRAFTGTL